MSDPVGKIEAVKNRLNTYVTNAIGGSAYNDWRIDVNSITSFPLSTLRLPNIDLVHENYGRLTPDAGRWAHYGFTIFIHEERDDQYGVGTPDDYQTLDAADDLIDYLYSIRGNEDEKTDYGIYWIYDLMIEATNQARSPRDISTINVSGKIRAKWLDT